MCVFTHVCVRACAHDVCMCECIYLCMYLFIYQAQSEYYQIILNFVSVSV